MAREENVFTSEGGPGLAEVWKGYAERDVLGAWIAADFEVVAPLRRVVEKPLVELTFMVHGDLGIALKEVRHGGKGIRSGGVRGGFGADGDQIFKCGFSGGAVVE